MEAPLLTSKRLAAIVGAVATILIISALVVRNHAKRLGWKEIESAQWGFRAYLPPPIESNRSAVDTPYGRAPLESFIGRIGLIRFTIAVAEYDPNVTVDFTEKERYESAAEATARMLQGKLTRHMVIDQGGLTGREQIIDVPEKCVLKTRAFLVRNRSYQAQVAIPSGASLDPALEKLFFDSHIIRFDRNPD
jgi:hypothetical protein